MTISGEVLCLLSSPFFMMLAMLLHQVLVRGQYRLICLWTDTNFHLLVFLSPTPTGTSGSLDFQKTIVLQLYARFLFFWCTEANQKWFMGCLSYYNNFLHLNVRKVFSTALKFYFCGILINIGGERQSVQINFCTPKFIFSSEISWDYSKWHFRLHNRTCIPLFNLSNFCNVTLQWLFCKTHLKMETQGVQIIFGYTVCPNTLTLYRWKICCSSVLF